MKSDTIGKLAEALGKAQSQMEHAKKDSKNPFFKSNYADLSAVLDAVKKPLTENGLSVSQLVGNGESDDVIMVTTLLMHTSGEWISSDLKMKPTKADPQGMGSAITYARRYALQAICGLGAEDDDGNQASVPQTSTDKAPVKPVQKSPHRQPNETIYSEDAKKLKTEFSFLADIAGVQPISLWNTCLAQLNMTDKQGMGQLTYAEMAQVKDWITAELKKQEEK